jgi:hypothetical protein
MDRGRARYLADSALSGHGVPAHRPNLEGLPPAFISCAEIDPCRDEAVEYAIRLFQAYVHTELHPPDDRVTFGDHIFGPDAKTDRCLVADEDRRAGESRQVDRPAGADDLDGVAGRDVLGPSGPRPCTVQIDEDGGVAGGVLPADGRVGAHRQPAPGDADLDLVAGCPRGVPWRDARQADLPKWSPVGDLRDSHGAKQPVRHRVGDEVVEAAHTVG